MPAPDSHKTPPKSARLLRCLAPSGGTAIPKWSFQESKMARNRRSRPGLPGPGKEWERPPPRVRAGPARAASQEKDAAGGDASCSPAGRTEISNPCLPSAPGNRLLSGLVTPATRRSAAASRAPRSSRPCRFRPARGTREPDRSPRLRRADRPPRRRRPSGPSGR